MTPSLAFAALLSIAAPTLVPSVCSPSEAGPVDPEAYRELWESGVTWQEFLADAESRRDGWLENWASSEGLDSAGVERARAVGGTWYVLAVAVDGCSDSVSTIPYLARLAERVDGLELRIVDSDAGRWVMEENPTPDGRAATPTVVLLDPDFEKRGCFIERPSALQSILLENQDELDQRQLYHFKMGWYHGNRGGTTVREIVRILEAAASDDAICG